MSQNIYFFGQNGLPDPAIWEVALSDLKGDYSVEVEEREDGAPVYGEIFVAGEDLFQFELYTPHQKAKGFDGESGSSVFDQEIEIAKQSKSGGSPEVISELGKTTELLVLAVSAEEQDDAALRRDIEPILDWLHRTSKGLHYVDGIGFHDASGPI